MTSDSEQPNTDSFHLAAPLAGAACGDEADEPTPKAQEGTWTLTAPDGRTWTAESPLRVCAKESRERVPAHVALARIARAVKEPDGAQQIAVALAAFTKILRTPALPFPDPVAHSLNAYARAVHSAWCQMRFIAIDAIKALEHGEQA